MLKMLLVGGCYPKGRKADAHDARWWGAGKEADAHDARWWGAATQRAGKLMLMMLAGGGLLPKGQELMLMMLAGGGLLPKDQGS